MQITNRYNLPEAIANAARRDTYSRGASRISVTQLISSPRIEALRSVHHDKMVVDITDRIWALLGTAVHHILEVGAEEGHTSEERLFTEVDGWTISGAVDIQADGGIIDYKCTSVYSVMNDKPDWETQLNLYAYLVRRSKGERIKKLQICAILRDWRKSDAERKPDYPQQPIVMVRVPLWAPERQDEYVAERVLLHKRAAAAVDLGTPLPLCSDEDRWARGDTWAVFKPEGKRAFRVVDTSEEADILATLTSKP